MGEFAFGGVYNVPATSHFFSNSNETVMKRFVFGMFALGCIALCGPVVFGQDATAVIDKAIKAHGGEEALKKVTAYSITANGAIAFMGTDSMVSTKATSKGLDRSRQEFEGDFGGNKVKGVTVIAGDKGWMTFGDMGANPLDSAQLTNAKRQCYINAAATTILPLKGKEFKTKLGEETKVGDKLAAVVQATGPDGKDFTLYFDKDSGMLIKVTAEGLLGFGGEEFKQEMFFKEYKDMGGIKKATKSEALRDGEKFITQEITEFKVLEKVDDATFAEPK